MFSTGTNSTSQLESFTADSAVKDLLDGACTVEELAIVAEFLDVEAERLCLIGKSVILFGELCVPSRSVIDELTVTKSNTLAEGRFLGFVVVTDGLEEPEIHYQIINPLLEPLDTPHFYGQLITYTTGNIGQTNIYLSQEEFDLKAAAEHLSEIPGLDFTELDVVLFDEDLTIEETLRAIQEIIFENPLCSPDADKAMRYVQEAMFGSAPHHLLIETRRTLHAHKDALPGEDLTELIDPSITLTVHCPIELITINDPGDKTDGKLISCLSFSDADATLYVPVSDILCMVSEN